MSSVYEEEIHPTPLGGNNHGPAPPQEYVIPPRPPIIIALQNPSSGSQPHSHPPSYQQSPRGSTVIGSDNLRGSTIIGSGYSSYLPDRHYPGAHADQGVQNSTAHGGSRAGSQARRSGVGRESTHSGHSAYTDDKRRDPEATWACPIGDTVAVRIGVEQAAGGLEADVRMARTQIIWWSKSINCWVTSVK